MQELTQEEATKLKGVVSHGIAVHEQIAVLKDGLKESVDEISEELDLKPAILNRAIRTAYRAELTAKKREMDDMEYILELVGRTL